MGVLDLLLNILIFSLPLGAISRFGIAPNAYLYVQDIVATGILMVFLWLTFIKKGKVKEYLNIKVIAAFIGFGFLSLVVNSSKLSIQEFFISFSYLVRFTSYVSLVFIPIFLTNKLIKSVNLKLIIVGTLLTIFGYIQYFYYPNLKNLYYLGWDDHLYRLFSTFLDPNFTGAFLVLFLLLISQNLIVSRVNFGKHKSKVIILGILWITTLVAILLTHSRSAFIMMIIGICVLLIISKLYKFLVVCIAFILFLFTIFSNTKIEGLNPFRVASSEARVETAGQALEIFTKNPIIGVGFNSYRYAQVRYGTRSEIGSLKSNADAGTDNSFLFVLVTTGVIGFMLYIYFWIDVIKFAYKEIKSGKNFYAPIVFASILAIFVDSLFINSLFYAPIMAWVFIVIGLMVSKKVMV